jgi:hypothetical protein
MGIDYWAGLLDWIRGTMLTGGKIGAHDLDLICLTDDPDKAVEHILEADQAAADRAAAKAAADLEAADKAADKGTDKGAGAAT